MISVIFIKLPDSSVKIFEHNVMVLASTPRANADPAANCTVQTNDRRPAKIAGNLLPVKAFIAMWTEELNNFLVFDRKF